MSKVKLWELGAHTLGKHLVLRSYLQAWLPKLGTWQGRIVVVDGFSGPGEYLGGEEGSPIIALRSFLEHSGQQFITANITFFFIDDSLPSLKHLKSIVDDRLEIPQNVTVQYAKDRFDTVVSKLFDKLEKNGNQIAPALFLVDPFGVKDTPMSIMERIFKHPRTEVYVSFMWEWINRFKSQPEFEQPLDELFGCRDWRDSLDISDTEERKEFLHELYEKQLRKAGAQHVVRFGLFEGNRHKYSIFFGTQTWQGADVMKKAIWKIAPRGTFEFRGGHTAQLTLGIEDAKVDFTPLRQAIIDRFAGVGWIHIDKLLEFVGSDETDFHTSHPKKNVLKPLEREGLLEVKAGTRQKKFTYPESCELRILLTDADS